MSESGSVDVKVKTAAVFSDNEFEDKDVIEGASFTSLMDMVKSFDTEFSSLSVAVIVIENEESFSKSVLIVSFNFKVVPSSSKESLSVPDIEYVMSSFSGSVTDSVPTAAPKLFSFI